MTDNLVSDWTLGAFKAREDKRRLLELAEAPGLATVAPADFGAEILLSDWTLSALQRREDERRKREQQAARHFAGGAKLENQIAAERIAESDWTLPALAKREAERRARDMQERPRAQAAQTRAAGPKPMITSDSQEVTAGARKNDGAGILLSDWTLPAVERREAARRKLETENARAAARETLEAQGVIESDWTLPAFAKREAERRARDMERPRAQAAAGRADGPSSEQIVTSDWTLAAFKRREEARYWAELVERKRAALQAAGRPEAETRAADKIQTAPAMAPAIKAALDERLGALPSGGAQGEAGRPQPMITAGERPAAAPEAAPIHLAQSGRREALGDREAPHVAESRSAAPAPELRASYAESMSPVRAARPAGDGNDQEDARARVPWAPRSAEADPSFRGLLGRMVTPRRLAFGFAALLAIGAGLFMARLFFQAETPAPREATRMERRRPPQTLASPAGGKIPAQRDTAAKKAVSSQPPADATHSAAPATPAPLGADQGAAAPPSVDEAARPAPPRQPDGQTQGAVAPAETAPSATREATKAPARPSAPPTGGSRETPQHADAKRKPAAAKDATPEARPKHTVSKVKKPEAGGGETPPAPQAPAAAPQPPAAAQEPATAPAPESGSLSGAFEKATGAVMDSLKQLGPGGAGQ